MIGDDKLPEDLKRSSSGPSIPCKFCTKNFLTSELLDAHLQRKHGTNDGAGLHTTIESQEGEQKRHKEREKDEKNDDKAVTKETKDHEEEEKFNRKAEAGQKDDEPKILEEKSQKNSKTKNQKENQRNATHQHDQVSSSASSSVSSTPRPILNGTIESGSVNYILVDRDQQVKLQTELKELKEKMNAAEKEFFQLTMMNNNNNDSISLSAACETCAKKKRVDLTNAAVQCGGNEKDIDTVSAEVQADLVEDLELTTDQTEEKKGNFPRFTRKKE